MNNVYDIERKMLGGDASNIGRNVSRIKEAFEGAGLFYEDPIGQPFTETRTDLEVSISGTRGDDLVVVDVIKPIIRCGERAYSRVVQKGVVVVRSRVEEEAIDASHD